MRSLTTLVLCSAMLIGVRTAAADAPVRLDLQLRDTTLRDTVKRVFTPAGVKVILAPELADLKISLNLKSAEPDHAVRLLVRQASKQVPNLEYETIDSGFRIFRGAKAAEAEKPLRFRSREEPERAKTQEAAPVSQVDQESVDPGSIFSEPRESSEVRGASPGRPGGVLYPGGWSTTYIDRNPFGLRARGPRNANPYSTPVGGGGSSSLAREPVDPKKTGPAPYFYSHRPFWILEPRTKYWTKSIGKPSAKPKSGGGGSGPLGGGYAPGNPFPVR